MKARCRCSTLGMAGARYLRNLIEGGRHRMIGMGHGRTLAAAVDLMPSVAGA